MNVPRGSLRTFLESAKTNLQNAIINQQRVTIVIGNESADLDSITSAIVLAYIKSNATTTPLTNPSVNKHTPPSQYPPFYIPVLNIPRADVHIRPELLKLLPHANLEPNHLITLDDLSATAPAGLNPTNKETLQPSLTRLLLTDHNRLAGPLAETFSDRVIGCIDHHVDEHKVPEDTGSEPRIIETAGSCNSLVIRYCRQAWDTLSSNTSSSASYSVSGQDDASVGVDDADVRRTWDAQIAKLSMASVLVDTNSLQDQNKTTEIDTAAVNYLESKITLAPGRTGAKWDREAFFKEISEAKSDLTSLSPEEILRKDYKQMSIVTKQFQLGISSVVKTLSWQIERTGGDGAGVNEFTDVMEKFASDRNLDCYAIMTTSTSASGQFQKELLLRSYSSKADSVVDEFEQKFGEELKLDEWTENGQLKDSAGGKLKVWWQRRVDYSRKQVAPILRKAIESA